MDLDESRKRLFEDSMNGPTPDVPIQDIFALYRRTKTLMSMHKAFVPKYVQSSMARCSSIESWYAVVTFSSIWPGSSNHMCNNGLSTSTTRQHSGSRL